MHTPTQRIDVRLLAYVVSALLTVFFMAPAHAVRIQLQGAAQCPRTHVSGLYVTGAFVQCINYDDTSATPIGAAAPVRNGGTTVRAFANCDEYAEGFQVHYTNAQNSAIQTQCLVAGVLVAGSSGTISVEENLISTAIDIFLIIAWAIATLYGFNSGLSFSTGPREGWGES